MPGIKGLQNYLEQLGPDIIQTFDPYSDPTYDSALISRRKSIKLFTASHWHASVFRKEEFAKTWRGILKDWLGRDAFQQKLRFIASQTIRCYPIAPDAADIAVRYFRVPKSKISIQPLGVDQSLFYPPSFEERVKIRERLSGEFGFARDALVCIYTGRFAGDKNPQCLAKAIDSLRRKNENVAGLFIGNGTSSETSEIIEKQGCYSRPFVPAKELRNFYCLADIAVWPAQESTSQLDAMACGVPLILSNRIEVVERIQGNGLLYEEGNAMDLAKKILQLKDQALRKQMSEIGIRKIQTQYSWETIARSRLVDYSSLSLWRFRTG